MSKRIEVPYDVTGYGYVALWGDGSGLGWWLPSHLVGNSYNYTSLPNPQMREYCNPTGERVFLCRITIEPVTDRLRRPITRIVKGTP